MDISAHFTSEEVETTDTGLPNACPDSLSSNAVALATEALEPSRILVGPLHVNSWYRCKVVNQKVHGDPNSAHLEARAADVVPNGNVFNAFKMLVASDIPYDKIIFEHHNSDWIHIQIRGGGLAPRRLAFTAKPNAKGKMVYEAYNG